MKAYVLLEIRTGDITTVIGHLKRVEGVIEANMTFGPYDAVAVVKAQNIKELGTILSQRIQPIPGVLETLTCMAVDSD